MNPDILEKCKQQIEYSILNFLQQQNQPVLLEKGIEIFNNMSENLIQRYERLDDYIRIRRLRNLAHRIKTNELSN